MANGANVTIFLVKRTGRKFAQATGSVNVDAACATLDGIRLVSIMLQIQLKTRKLPWLFFGKGLSTRITTTTKPLVDFDDLKQDIILTRNLL